MFSFGLKEIKRDVFGAGSAVGGIAQAAGAVGAASIQASAADHAADLQSQAAQNALNFQTNEFNTQQTNEKPFLQAGQGAIGQLSGMLQPGGSLSQQWNQQFQAPTSVTEQNDPGYQFRMQQGQLALQRAQAASGGAMGGAAAKELTQYNQNYASNEYSNVYNRALTQYQQSYNQFQQGQTNTFNRLASVAGIGQTSAGQLGQEGSAAATNVGNLYGQLGNAQSAGVVGIGNALSSGVTGATNALQQSSYMNSILGNMSGGYSNTGGYFGGMTGNAPTEPTFMSGDSGELDGGGD